MGSLFRILWCLCMGMPVLSGGITAEGAAHRDQYATPVGDWLVQTWESEDGLPENSATAMVQTPDHYLWFGTFNGLVRFDGVQFTVLNTANTPHLPSSGIVNLHLDKAGRLWVSTLEGLVWREGDRWGEPPGRKPVSHDPIRTFSERANGDLLLTTFDGQVFEFTGGVLRALLPPPSGIPGGYHGGVDADGRWWVVQVGFIGRWTGVAWERTVPTEGISTIHSGRLACAQARAGGVWVLAVTDLRRFVEGVEVERRQIPDSGSEVWSLYEDSRGHLWVCTIAQGVMQVLPDGQVHRWNEGTGLSYHGVRFVFEDVERNVWIGTSGGGLTRFKTRRFTTFGRDQGLTERVVKSVWPTKQGGLWIGTYGQGLFQLCDQAIRPVLMPVPLPSRRYVQSVLTDREGRTWLGTFGEELGVLKGSEWTSVSGEQSGGRNVIALFEDSQGRVWISGGTDIGMFEKGIFRTFGAEAGVPRGGVRGFGEDSEKRIWFSSFGGVFRLEGDRWMEVLSPDGAPYRDVACFMGEADGTWWMGTLNDGLIQWRPDRVRRVLPHHGLPVPGVYAMVADGRGDVWMSSAHGIVRASLAVLNQVANGVESQLSAQLLDSNDGLASGECPAGQQPIAARDEQGRVWFATLKGVAMVDPSRFRTNPVLCRPIIESLVYNLETRSATPGLPIERRLEAPFPGAFELPPGSDRIEVHYTAPSFASPGKVRFQYRLEGANQPWRDAGVRRVAYFENLAPDAYRFEVRAANDNGVWNPEPATLAFTVQPHFWQTWTFRGFLGVALVGLGFAWNRRRQNLQKEKSDHQVRFTRQLIASQEAERARIARELHDDLCQRLARLAIDTGQIETATTTPAQRQALRGVQEGLARISEDVHELSYGLHPSILADLGLVEALRSEGERLARRNPLEIRFRVSGIPDVIPQDPALCLYRVGEEALHNVVRHAQARRVEVSLRAEDGGVQLAIQDDGTGFEPSLERRRPSLGLTGMRERVALLGGNLDIESAPGAGCLIVAWLPLRTTTV